jgi:drug/metabolite transporter (DMT)-like permease
MAYLAVFGSALGWVVLGEVLAPTQIAGMLVVLIGVALVTLGR